MEFREKPMQNLIRIKEKDFAGILMYERKS